MPLAYLPFAYLHQTQIMPSPSISHLDLDTLAWEAQETPLRRSLSASVKDIKNFIHLHNNWIIEGCYGDLITEILPFINLLIFLNPDVDTCLNNAKNRAWESHKYKSLEAQNANLQFLEQWIKDYFDRQDEFSFSYHQQLFRSFSGKKIEYNHNWDNNLLKMIRNYHN
ncbi:shikimate kinase [Geminocystis herdmanii]|uniref:shikimate kinase n=1 Tax=Geminocystis herdmanii TaxID=669359 RepID=UPI001181BCB7|nr:shikimate kinase [Geminocystis herdmanii]